MPPIRWNRHCYFYFQGVTTDKERYWAAGKGEGLIWKEVCLNFSTRKALNVNITETNRRGAVSKNTTRMRASKQLHYLHNSLVRHIPRFQKSNDPMIVCLFFTFFLSPYMYMYIILLRSNHQEWTKRSGMETEREKQTERERRGSVCALGIFGEVYMTVTVTPVNTKT